MRRKRVWALLLLCTLPSPLWGAWSQAAAPAAMFPAPVPPASVEGSIAPEQASVPLEVREVFPGLPFDGRIPPNPTVAVGPNHVLLVHNGALRVQARTGEVLWEQELLSFFSPLAQSADFLTDPRAMFDAGRFWLVVAARRPSPLSSFFFLAVSRTADATGPWWLYALDVNSQGSSDFADLPSIGSDDRAIYLTANLFDLDTLDFRGALIRVLPKAAALQGAPVSWHDFRGLSAGGTAAFHLVAAQAWSPAPAGYIAATRFPAACELAVWRVITPETGDPLLTLRRIPVQPPCGPPPNAAQQGSSVRIETGGPRLNSAIWRDDSLWLAATAGFDWGSGLAATVRVWQVHTAGFPAVNLLQDFWHGAAGIHTFYPALAVDPAGNALLTYNSSGASAFVGLFAAGQLRQDARNALGAPIGIQAGLDSYVRLDSQGRNRWGDYNTAVVDPVDNSFWVFGEVADRDNQWQTVLARLAFAFPTPTATRTGTATGTPTASRTATPTPTRTRTPLPSVTPSSSGTPTRTATRTATPSPTWSATASPSATRSPSPTSTATFSVTPSPTRSATYSPTPTVTPTFTATPSRTPTATASASPSVTASPTASATPTPSRSPRPSATFSPSSTYTITRTPTVTRTPSRSPSPTATATRIPTRTHTPTREPTLTATPTWTVTPTRTHTPTRTATGPTPTPSPTPSASPSPSAPTRTPTGSPTSSPTPTPTLSPPPSSTPSFTASASPTLSPTLEPTATPSATPSLTATATASPSPSHSSTPSATPSASWTVPPSPSPSRTATASVSPSASATNTRTVTRTLSATVTATPSASQSAPPSATPSASATQTPTASPSRSLTASRTPTLTASPTATPSRTPSASPSVTASYTMTATATLSATPSASPSPTPSRTTTPSPTASHSASPTLTATLTPTASASPTPTASATPTKTPSPTSSPTPPSARADFDGDGVLSEADLRILLRQIFSPQALSRSADLNHDGHVSAADVTAFLLLWQEPPLP